MHPEPIDEVVAELRAHGGDSMAVEVKSAAGGLPSSLRESMSALANLPGGGLLILGLDEAAGFAPVQLANRQALKQGLASQAGELSPPAHLAIQEETVEGQPVIVARVAECPPSDKPCRVLSTGRAYLRAHDGDYQLSALEEQGFLRAREAPLADRTPVQGTGRGDLDRDLLAAWHRQVRAHRPALARFDGDDLLRRAGVLTGNGELTRAGLLTLGEYPQQHLPQFVVRVADVRADDPAVRARNAVVLDGAIPRMLSATMAWLRSNLPTRITAAGDGAVRDVAEYPLEALRELVSNALVHRDLDAWSEGMAVELRLQRDRLVLTNPGGLYGIALDRLGGDHVTSARNARLVALCADARDPEDNSRVIEALASGLPRVAATLREAGLPPAQYYDTGLRFTVVLRSGPPSEAIPTASSSTWQPAAPRPGTQLAVVLQALRHRGGQTVEELALATGIAETSVRRALTRLRLEYRLVHIDEGGGPGRHTTYSVAPSGP